MDIQLPPISTPNSIIGTYKNIFGSDNFVGAQPLQYLGDKTVEILRNKKFITFSPKLDGVRFLCLIQGQYITFFARGNKPQTWLDKSRDRISKDSIEKVIVLDIEYVESLNSIFAFDILVHNGMDVREWSYTDRRKLLVSKYKNFSREIKIFKFFINESYRIDDLDKPLLSYMVAAESDKCRNIPLYCYFEQQVFFEDFIGTNLNFDGVIFYDGRYSYPTGSSPAHYGTWKWKPPHELTIDLRIINGKATFYDKKQGWVSVTRKFPIRKVTLPKPVTETTNPFDDVLNQGEEESYEFNLVVSNTRDKFDLVPKMSRDKKANSYLNIKTTIAAFKENINLEDIRQFYNFFYNRDNFSAGNMEKFPMNTFKRLAFVSSIVPPPKSKPNRYMVDFTLRSVPNFYGFKDYSIERGKIIDYSDLLLRFRNEISQLSGTIEKLNQEFKVEKTKIESNTYSAKEQLKRAIEKLNKRPDVKAGKIQEINIEIIRNIMDDMKGLERDYWDSEIKDQDMLNKGRSELLSPYKLRFSRGKYEIPEIIPSYEEISGYLKYSETGGKYLIDDLWKFKTQKESEIEKEIKRIEEEVKSLKTQARMENLQLMDNKVVKEMMKSYSEWFYIDSKRRQQPTDKEGGFTNEEMKRLYNDGVINKDTLVQDSYTGVNRFDTVENLSVDRGLSSPRELFTTVTYWVDKLKYSKKGIRYIDSKIPGPKFRAEKGTTVAYVRFNFSSDKVPRNAQVFNQLITYCNLVPDSTIIYKSTVKRNGKEITENRLRIDDNSFELYDEPRDVNLKNINKIFECRTQLVEGRNYSYRLPKYLRDKPIRIIGKRHTKSNVVIEPTFKEKVNWYRETREGPIPMREETRLDKLNVDSNSYFPIQIYYGNQGLRLMKMGGQYIIEMKLPLEKLKSKKDVKNIRVNLISLLSQVV